MKTLMLISGNNFSIFPSHNPYCNIEILFKKNTFFHRILRKILFFIRWPWIDCLFGDWRKLAERAELIVLFDSGNSEYILQYLVRKFPNARIILWYWNPVSKSINPKKIDRTKVELWSFDPSDCKQYKMKYNTQFFIKENLSRVILPDEHHTAFFVGKEKGRLEDLQFLHDVFIANEIDSYFHIVGDKKKEVPGFGQNYANALTYPEILGYDIFSDVIIDLVSPDQHGLTLRPLEALVLGKKLITNFSKIKQFDFYRPENIFIIYEDDILHLKDFIQMPGVNVNYHRYEFGEWLGRF